MKKLFVTLGLLAAVLICGGWNVHGIPSPSTSFMLVNTGSFMLVNTGSKLKVK